MQQLNKIINTDCLDGLKTLPDNCIDCCVTSPPYWGLRDYGVTGQLGLEATPELFVQKMVTVFNEVKRVLKPTGTLWLNLGDSYSGSGSHSPDHAGQGLHLKVNQHGGPRGNKITTGLKSKDLIGIPWMVAFALRSAGWYLRQDIIWSKPNPMPESVTDRCTKSHEYIFLLSRSAKYYYDAEAIKTPTIEPEKTRSDSKKTFPTKLINGIRNTHIPYEMANKRSVWEVNPIPFAEAHFATFPQKLITDCIKAGTSEHGNCSNCGHPYMRVVEKSGGSIGSGSWTKQGTDIKYGMLAPNTTKAKKLMNNNGYKVEHKGWQQTCNCETQTLKPAIVLDPFMGAGTTAVVAKKLNRNFIGFELNAQYIAIAEKRLYNEIGMFL